MIITILDGNGTPRLVSWVGPGTAADTSGVVLANLPVSGPPFTYQQILPTIQAGFPYRGGWFIRNMGTNAMKITEDGSDPSISITAVTVFPGEIFPPPGMPYPITQGAVNLSGSPGDSFSCKNW